MCQDQMNTSGVYNKINIVFIYLKTFVQTNSLKSHETLNLNLNKIKQETDVRL